MTKITCLTLFFIFLGLYARRRALVALSEFTRGLVLSVDFWALSVLFYNRSSAEC